MKMTRMTNGDTTRLAVRALLTAYWQNGWRRTPELPEGDVLDNAVDAEVMFRNPVTAGHDDWVRTVRDAACTVTSAEAGNAFLTSLSSRRLELRSVLSSLAIARQVPEHQFTPGPDGLHCTVCGVAGEDAQDRNILNFERYKWGGVRLDNLLYVAHDLDLAARVPRSAPNDDDLALGRKLLARSHAPTPTTPPSAWPRRSPSSRATRWSGPTCCRYSASAVSW